MQFRLLLVGAVVVLFPVAGAEGQAGKSPVKVTVEAGKPDAEGKQVLKIVFKIEPGWHIYANPPENDELANARTVVSFAGKNKPKSVQIEYPEGKATEAFGKKFKAYKEEAVIRALIQREAAGALELQVRFMACDKDSCIPSKVQLTVD